MTTQIRFQPTLFIFMGTSSGQIGWRVKKLLHEAYGDVPVLRFLWIDIDSDIDPLARPWFSSDERIELSGLNPAAVIKNINLYPTIKDWWPNADVPAGMLAGGGSPQQMRLVGRLALFRMYNDRLRGPALIDKIKGAVDALFEIENIRKTTAKSDNKTTYSVEGGCRVILVFSPCGGTGSAISFDIAYICHKLLEDKDPTIISIGVLPPVIDKAIKNETHNQIEKIRANAYAWFKEDNYLTEHPYWNISYPEGAPVIIPAPPFKFKFILDLENQAGYRLNSTDDVFNMIAQSIFMDTGSSIAGAMRGFTANVGALGDYFEGANRSFSSLAAASLIFPKQELLEYCSKRFAGLLLSEGMMSEPNDQQLGVSAASLLSQFHLRDSEIMSEIMEQAKFSMQMEPIIRKADSVAAALSEIDKQENQNKVIRQSIGEKIKKFGETRTIVLSKTINKELANIAATYGIRFAITVTDRLLEPSPSGMVEPGVVSFEGHKARIIQRGYKESDLDAALKDFQKAREALANLDNGPEDALERLINQKGWNRKFLLFKNDCIKAMAKVNEISTNLSAQQKALDIYDQIASVLGELKTSMLAAATRINIVAKELETESAKIADRDSRKTDGFEFLQEIDVDFSQYFTEHAADIIPATVIKGMIPAIEIQSIQTLEKWISEQIKEASIAYAGLFFAPELDSTSLLDVLKRTAIERGLDPSSYIKQQLDDLVGYCHPFWQYDKNRGLHDMEGKSIIGVEDENHSAIPAEYQTSQRFEVKTTGFRDRVDIVRIQHGLPAFLIRGMDEYKVVFEKRRKGKDPLHILPGMDVATDLMPEHDTQNRELFTIAMAFDYIVKSGSWYYYDQKREFISHKMRPGREYRLAQGREKSEDVFAKRQEWVQQVEQMVEKEVERMGNDAAITKLSQQVEERKKEIAKMAIDDLMRKQLEKEIKALEDMQRKLGKSF